jgi:hypothetical protein
MAVVGTVRSRTWRSVTVHGRWPVLRLELLLGLAKLGGALALFGILYLPSVLSVTPMRVVENPRVGIRLFYPAAWQEAKESTFGCRASARPQNWYWRGYLSFMRSETVAARFASIPLYIYERGPWAAGLPEAAAWSPAELTATVVDRLGFLPPLEGTRIRWTRLLGGTAVEVSGPRALGRWGIAVFRVEGPDLLLFDAVAPDQGSFRRSLPDWRRMVRRLERFPGTPRYRKYLLYCEGYGPEVLAEDAARVSR